jgi:hypothetical protein
MRMQAICALKYLGSQESYAGTAPLPVRAGYIRLYTLLGSGVGLAFGGCA